MYCKIFRSTEDLKVTKFSVSSVLVRVDNPFLTGKIIFLKAQGKASHFMKTEGTHYR
jgi:hypothetical protein